MIGSADESADLAALLDVDLDDLAAVIGRGWRRTATRDEPPHDVRALLPARDRPVDTYVSGALFTEVDHAAEAARLGVARGSWPGPGELRMVAGEATAIVP